MNLDDVVAEVRAALDTVPGLRVPEWGDRATAAQLPCALVGWPAGEGVVFDGAYDRGHDRYPDLPVFVCVSSKAGRAAAQEMSGYLAGNGPTSVKRALEAYEYTSCDFVHVASADLDPEGRVGEASCLVAIFHCSITGPGEV